MSRASAIMVPNLMMGQKQNGPDGSRQIAARERHPGVDDAVDAMDASAAAATAAAEAAAVAAAVSGTGDEPQTARKAAAAKADAGKHFKFFGFDQKTDNNIRIVSHLHTTSQYTRKEVPHTDLDAYLTVVARNRNQPPSPGLGPTSGSGAGLGSHQGATPAEDTKRIFPVHCELCSAQLPLFWRWLISCCLRCVCRACDLRAGRARDGDAAEALPARPARSQRRALHGCALLPPMAPFAFARCLVLAVPLV